MYSLAAFSAFTLWGCSVHLTRGNQKEKTVDEIPQDRSTFLFQAIPMVLGADTLQLEQDLLFAYDKAAPLESFPREQCQGTAQILAQVRQNKETGASSLPLVIFPFWPIQPVDETWTYKLNARIDCNGAVVKQLEFIEEETIQATLYGKLRSDLLNGASTAMHQKLLARLSFELGYHYNADLNSRSDY